MDVQAKQKQTHKQNHKLVVTKGKRKQGGKIRDIGFTDKTDNNRINCTAQEIQPLSCNNLIMEDNL